MERVVAGGFEWWFLGDCKSDSLLLYEEEAEFEEFGVVVEVVIVFETGDGKKDVVLPGESMIEERGVFM